MGCSQAAPLRPVWRRRPGSSEVPNTLGHFFAPQLILWTHLMIWPVQTSNGPPHREQMWCGLVLRPCSAALRPVGAAGHHSRRLLSFHGARDARGTTISERATRARERRATTTTTVTSCSCRRWEKNGENAFGDVLEPKLRPDRAHRWPTATRKKEKIILYVVVFTLHSLLPRSRSSGR